MATASAPAGTLAGNVNLTSGIGLETAVNRLTFSLKWLLVVVSAFAITATSLAYASLFWASLCLSLALIMLSVGILGVMNRRGDKRAYWTGFTLFGICYLVLVFAPGFDRVIGHRLVTTKVLGYIEPRVRRTENHLKQIFGDVPAEVATNPVHEAMLNLGGRQQTLYPQWGHFQEAGHSAFAIVLAIIGGAVARCFYTTDEPADRT